MSYTMYDYEYVVLRDDVQSSYKIHKRNRKSSYKTSKQMDEVKWVSLI